MWGREERGWGFATVIHSAKSQTPPPFFFLLNENVVFAKELSLPMQRKGKNQLQRAGGPAFFGSSGTASYPAQVLPVGAAAPLRVWGRAERGGGLKFIPDPRPKQRLVVEWFPARSEVVATTARPLRLSSPSAVVGSAPSGYAHSISVSGKKDRRRWAVSGGAERPSACRASSWQAGGGADGAGLAPPPLRPPSGLSFFRLSE